MSETPTTPITPTTPAKEADTKKPVTTTTNGSNAKKFEGDGLPFKGKLIGMEDLSIDRDEKICLDSMFKLKAVVKARGEHKQRIQLNLTMTAVKIIDDTTKAQIATHEIERISFVVIDPRDTRAFGYIYNTSDDRHQFWAIKTERAAAATVLALKELFELAFEEYTKNQTVTTLPTSPVSPPQETTPQVQATQQIPPVVTPPVSEPAPPSQPAPTPSVPAPVPSLFGDDLWGDTPTPTTTVIPKAQEQTPNLFDLPDLSAPAPAPVVQQTQKPLDPFGDIFGDLSTTTTTPSPQPAVSTSTTSPLFDVFSSGAPTPSPIPAPQFGNFNTQPAQPNLLNPTPTLSQQQQQRPITPTGMFNQQQQDLLNPSPVSPVAPPTVTSPFADLDFLGGLSLSSNQGKVTKDLFFPQTQQAKTIQQMQIEKQP